MFAPAQCENSDFIPSPFALTFTPEIVFRDVTKDIRISCGYDGKTKSQLKQISRVVLLKKSTSTWNQLAESKWYNTSLQALAMKKSVKQETLLKFKWEVADHSIFGSYRCDVIGFDKMAASVTESTLEVDLPNIDLTSFLIKTNAKQRRQIDSLQNEIDSLKASSAEDRRELESVKGNVAMLNTKLNNISTDLRVETMDRNSLAAEVHQNISVLHKNFTGNKLSMKSFLFEQRQDILSLQDDLLSIKNDIFVAKVGIKHNKVNISLFNDRLHSATTYTESLEKNATDTKGRVSSLQGQISFVHEKLLFINSSNKEKLTHLAEDLTKFKSNATSMFANLYASDIMGAASSSDLHSVEQELVSVNENILTLQKDITKVGQNVSLLFLSQSKEVEILSKSITPINDQLQSIKEQLFTTKKKMLRIIVETYLQTRGSLQKLKMV